MKKFSIDVVKIRGYITVADLPCIWVWKEKHTAVNKSTQIFYRLLCKINF